MPDWTGVTCGWKDGDASPGGGGPDPKARWAGATTSAAGAAAGIPMTATALLGAAMRRR